jgi:hypothetical protein
MCSILRGIRLPNAAQLRVWRQPAAAVTQAVAAQLGAPAQSLLRTIAAAQAPTRATRSDRVPTPLPVPLDDRD